MFDIGFLDIILGLIFVYLLFSTLVTLLVEYVSAYLQLRGKNLRKIITRALDDDIGPNEISEEFYNHPLIKYLSKKKGKLPSYISSDKFAKVVLDLIRTGADLKQLGHSSNLEENTKLSEAIDKMPDVLGPETKSLLKSFAKESAEDINDFGERLENWFDETVERGKGWFSRQIKWVTLGVSIVVAIGLNVDTIRIYQELSQDDELRAEIAASASDYFKSAKKPDDPEELEEFNTAQRELEHFYKEEIKGEVNRLGLGWNQTSLQRMNSVRGFLLTLIGWVMTGFAISLGAPFWFGMFNKISAIRSTGKDIGAFKEKKKQVKES